MLPIWTLGETSQRFCPCPEGPARRRREPLRARVVAEPVLLHTGSSPTTSTAALAVRKTSCYRARTCEVAAESRGRESSPAFAFLHVRTGCDAATRCPLHAVRWSWDSPRAPRQWDLPKFTLTVAPNEVTPPFR